MPNMYSEADGADELEDDAGHEEGVGVHVHSVPKGPTQQEIDEHNATHIPYRSWCRWCVMGKKPNLRHSRSSSARDVPLLVGDYCFVRDARDEDLLTL